MNVNSHSDREFENLFINDCYCYFVMEYFYTFG